MHKDKAMKLAVLTITGIVRQGPLQAECLGQLCGRATPSEALKVFPA